MIKPLALYIGLRYTQAKRRNQFISFVSLISLLGMILGVFALIVVLSVIDNLVKGAAGQAVQNMNILCGLDENCGLNHVALMP